ncbi:MAG: efflux RND transporter periplasmic adaptor subunit [Candidatus Devosia phytovorans]|uniref:Efflux RND transporter periplasmic adaptor subunit n=1 Tax=Candidatus Devosia phytovorans TaxID=3121372 RepID=A0AAJ6AZZ0_9HYPH|nr:efflux RND transporter periplasmic adaptor subunit [Devosia sp.]WEK05105.1 MAG: efflux RND transporter periplasmic adaptor subunit [Devosia sp.]
MIRQLVISIVILLAAFAAWVAFVPGSRDVLAGYGITLPFAEQTAAAAVAEARPPGQGRPGGAGRVTNVVTTAVGMSTINDGLSAIGEGTSFRSVTVSSSVGGTLEELLVSPGHQVEAGDIIGRLDADDQQVAYDLALLAVEDARATLARTQGLATSNVVATTALTAAQLASANAELDLRNAQNNLGRRTITTPIDGTIGLMQVTPGNYLSAQTTVTTIDDNSSILVNFWVPERYAASLRTDMPVSVSAVALPGRTFDGQISAIDNRIDPASRTLQVQAAIPNDDGLMRAGMSFVVNIAFPGEQFPTVNPLAILWSADGSYVWKYVDGAATHVPAEIVQRNSDGVLVRSNLKPGDAIITEGILQLSEGARVTLLEGPDGTGSTEEAAASAAPAQPI